MKIERKNPIVIHCKACGAALDFDIVNQNYQCKFCGETIDMKTPATHLMAWKNAKDVELRQSNDIDEKVMCTCRHCGAKVVMNSDEALGKCEFCGGNMLRSEFVMEDTFPAALIPFFIQEEEAKEELKRWAQSHSSKKESSKLLEHLSEVKGYYLPYQMVRGPISCQIKRDATQRKYQCGGYLDGMVVNSSKNLNNMVLDAIEPFDFQALKEMEFGYIAGQKVKLPDLEEKELENRVMEEVQSDYEKVVCKTLQTTGIQIKPNIQDMLIMPALMPVYVINTDEISAAVNGQTGRVAVLRKKDQVTIPWVIEPLLITLLVSLLSWYLAKDTGLTAMFAVITALPVFVAFGKNRTKRVKQKIYTSKPDVLERVDGKLIQKEIDKKREEQQTQYEPVFFETIQGKKETVKVSFYTASRILRWIVCLFVYNFLPVILVAGIDLARGIQGKPFFPIELVYMGAWLCLSISSSFIFVMMLGRIGVYNYPVFSRITSDHNIEKIPAKYYQKSAIKDWVAGVPKAILVFFAMVLFFFLFGTVFAMIS